MIRVGLCRLGRAVRLQIDDTIAIQHTQCAQAVHCKAHHVTMPMVQHTCLTYACGAGLSDGNSSTTHLQMALALLQ